MKKNMYSFFFAALLFSFGASQAFAQPANDECSGAFDLTADASCTPIAGTFLSSDPATTSSGAFTSSCEFDNHGDIWYKVIATDEGRYIFNLTDISTTDPNVNSAYVDITVYKGTCADLGSDAYQSCSDANYNSGGTGENSDPITINAIPDDVYYVRITRDNAYDADFNSITPTDLSFNLCTQYLPSLPPPTNDECGNAVLLSNATYNGNNVGATESRPASACGTAGSSVTDVWYTFIPEESGN